MVKMIHRWLYRIRVEWAHMLRLPMAMGLRMQHPPDRADERLWFAAAAKAVRADARKKAANGRIWEARGNLWFGPGPWQNHKSHARKSKNAGTGN